MLHAFMQANRVELMTRCRAKVVTRLSPTPTALEVGHGVPVLIDQLVEMLRAQRSVLGGALPDAPTTEIDRSATKHGAELYWRGYTVDQLVHDYGDLCQAVTELAHERDEPITVEEFHTFNRCLDSAIAGAVIEFGRQRDRVVLVEGAKTLSQRLGELAHELRNLVNTGMLAYSAIKGGHGAVAGATGAVLDRSFASLRSLIDHALAEVRLTNGLDAIPESTPLDVVLEEVRVAAQLDASARSIRFVVTVEPGLAVATDRQMLSSALANLLQNAFKFSRLGGHVALTARVVAGHVRIEVADQCGGLPSGRDEDLFRPFTQRSENRSGLGLGLSISRRAVEANGGTLTVRNVPGTGCIFTIELPLT